MKAPRKWIDPFDEMPDDEFDAHVDQLFAARAKTVAVSLRVAPELLQRVKRQAERLGVPYQTFVGSVVEEAWRVPPTPYGKTSREANARRETLAAERRTGVSRRWHPDLSDARWRA